MNLSNYLISALLLTTTTFNTANASADEEQKKPEVGLIKPTKQVTEAKAAIIDTEKFELGFNLGMLSTEDFNTNGTYGLTFTYHVTPDIHAHLITGRSSVDRATFEEIQDSNFLREGDRTFSYTSYGLGYRVVNGRSYLGKNYKYDSAIYVQAGFGNYSFAGNSDSGGFLGVSYRVVATDWLIWSVDFRNHIFKRNIKTIYDTDKVTHNTELTTGFNFLF